MAELATQTAMVVVIVTVIVVAAPDHKAFTRGTLDVLGPAGSLHGPQHPQSLQWEMIQPMKSFWACDDTLRRLYIPFWFQTTWFPMKSSSALNPRPSAHTKAQCERGRCTPAAEGECLCLGDLCVRSYDDGVPIRWTSMKDAR